LTAAAAIHSVMRRLQLAATNRARSARRNFD
jgi:hypothetical protein